MITISWKYPIPRPGFTKVSHVAFDCIVHVQYSGVSKPVHDSSIVYHKDCPEKISDHALS